MSKLANPWILMILGLLLYAASFSYFMISGINKILPIPEPRIITIEKQIARTFDLNSQEIQSLIEELNTEREKLDNERRDLNQIKESINRERKELDEIRTQIERVRNDINKSILTIDQSEVENFKELVAFYSEMGPENALKIINQFDETYLVRLLYFMDFETRLTFFETITEQSPTRAKNLLEMLRKFVPPENNPIVQTS